MSQEGGGVVSFSDESPVQSGLSPGKKRLGERKLPAVRLTVPSPLTRLTYKSCFLRNQECFPAPSTVPGVDSTRCLPRPRDAACSTPGKHSCEGSNGGWEYCSLEFKLSKGNCGLPPMMPKSKADSNVKCVQKPYGIECGSHKLYDE